MTLTVQRFLKTTNVGNIKTSMKNRRVFVNADERLDVRRRNILNRLKSPAIAARKDVSVTDGVLLVKV